MTHTPPNDQTIVDEYFKLRTNRKRSRLAWLFGMIATYGLTPDALEGFSWGPEASIYIQGKRRPVSPVHPQWAIIFRLKEEQPRNWQDCLQSLSEQLYCAMAYQKVGVNITDLLLSHQMRKRLYRSVKRPRKVLRPLAGVS